jgi:hypothetical protein
MSPHIKNSVSGSYRYFKVSSRFSMNRLKSPVGALYKLNEVQVVTVNVLYVSLCLCF